MDAETLTVRIGSDLLRRLDQEARCRGTTKTELLREILVAALAGGSVADLAKEARRQSTLVSSGPSERAALDFLDHAADTRGWE
jgi:predicted transcriptional regulator